jgi:drug/metabolite transporter (DMT)-like permease
MSLRVWMMMTLLGLLWSGTFFLTEILLERFGPFTIVFHRVGIAALAMLALLWFRGKKLPRDVRSWGGFIVMGFLNNALPFSAIVFGQQYITGGLASILNSTTAFIAVVVSGIFLADEKLTPVRFVGVTFGVVGVALAMGIETLGELSLSSIGQFCILLSSTSYVLASIWGKLKLRKHDTEVTATGMLITSTGWMFAITLVMEGSPFVLMSGVILGSFLTYAVLCTSLAYILYFALLKEAGAGNTMLVTIIIPPFSLLLDAFVLGQWVKPHEILGFGVIAIGLLILSNKIKLSNSAVGK